MASANLRTPLPSAPPSSSSLSRSSQPVGYNSLPSDEQNEQPPSSCSRFFGNLWNTVTHKPAIPIPGYVSVGTKLLATMALSATYSTLTRCMAGEDPANALAKTFSEKAVFVVSIVALYSGEIATGAINFFYSSDGKLADNATKAEALITNNQELNPLKLTPLGELTDDAEATASDERKIRALSGISTLGLFITTLQQGFAQQAINAVILGGFTAFSVLVLGNSSQIIKDTEGQVKEKIERVAKTIRESITNNSTEFVTLIGGLISNNALSEEFAKEMIKEVFSVSDPKNGVNTLYANANPNTKKAIQILYSAAKLKNIRTSPTNSTPIDKAKIGEYKLEAKQAFTTTVVNRPIPSPAYAPPLNDNGKNEKV